MRSLGFLFCFLAVFSITTAQARTRVLAPHTIIMERQDDPDGSWLPTTLDIRVGDTAEFTNLGVGHSVVPVLTVEADPCHADNAIAYTVDEDGDPIGPIGPERFHRSGIFARGPGGAGDGGPEIIDYTGCAGPPGSAGCCDVDPSPLVVGDFAYCGAQEGVASVAPQQVWDMDGIRGVLVILDWNQLEVDGDGDWDDSDLISELTSAAERGKAVSLAVRGGGEATPTWLFEPPVSAYAVELEGNNDNDPGPNNCGQDYTMGDFTDPAYVQQIEEVITHVASVVKSNGAWKQATTSFTLMGINTISDELKFMKSAPDNYRNCTAADLVDCNAAGGPGSCPGVPECNCATEGACVEEHDGILDSYNGDDCTHNARQWALAGYTPQRLYDFEVAQAAFIRDAFWEGITVKFPLIQGGFMKSQNATNFEGDHLRDPVTLACYVDPDGDDNCAENTADDGAQTNGIRQLEQLIGRLRLELGYGLWVMHFGLGEYPTEVEDTAPAPSNCSWGGVVDLLADPPQVEFPIPLVGDVDQEPQCPNSWAAETSFGDPPYLTGFQTNNQGGGMDDGDAVESSFWNLVRNSNAIYEEIYSSMAWFVIETIGGSHLEMNPDRRTLGEPDVDDDVAETLSMNEWNQVLRERREHPIFSEFVGLENPESFTYLFTAEDVGTITIHDPSVCSLGAAPTATITVTSS
jgi:hypothetical protein